MNLIITLLLLSITQICANNQLEIPITYSGLYFQNTSFEKLNNHGSMFDLLGMGYYIGAHNRPSSGYGLMSDKDSLPGYKVRFDMNMLHTDPAISWMKRKLNPDYENNSSYFASKFDNYRPTRVFHCVGNYRYKGFRDYVKNKPGFADFILDIGEQLKSGSELHKKLARAKDLESFAALKKLHQEKVRELEQKAQTKQQIDLRNNLRTRNFNEHGIKLLEHYGVADQFLYTGNSDQQAQLKQIANLMNETGEFKNNYEHSPELSEIAKNTFCFGNLANHANREKMMSLSQMCLDIGQSFLALGRGIVHSGKHTINSLCTLACHPGQVFQEICTAVKDIGIGIANIATLVPRFETAVDFGDAQMLSDVNQDLDRYCDNVGNLCKSVKYILCDASEIERLEMIGALATDVLTAHLGGKLLSAIPNTTPIRYVASYKPVALAKLGDLGREINQITGLALTKGAKAVKRGFEVIEACPQILKIKDSTVEVVKHCNKKIKAVNQYFDKKISKIINQQLELAAVGVQGGRNLLLHEKQIVKAMPNIPKASRKVMAEPFSGISKELAIFFDESENLITQKEHCKQICQSFLQDSSDFKLPSNCLNHMVEQIAEAESYLNGVSVNEFSCGRFGLSQELGNQRFKFDYAHFLHPVPELKCRNGRWCAEGFKGFHLDYLGTLEKAGELSCEILETGPFGTYRANIKPRGFFRVEPDKTMYPKHWRIVDVIKANREAILSTEMNFKI